MKISKLKELIKNAQPKFLEETGASLLVHDDPINAIIGIGWEKIIFNKQGNKNPSGDWIRIDIENMEDEKFLDDVFQIFKAQILKFDNQKR